MLASAAMLLPATAARPLCARPLRSSTATLAAARSSSAAPRRRRAVAAAAAGQRQRPQTPAAALPLAAALAAAGIVLPAGAEEAAEQSLAAFGGSDALAAAQAAAESDPSDLIFSALFTIASELPNLLVWLAVGWRNAAWQDSSTRIAHSHAIWSRQLPAHPASPSSCQPLRLLPFPACCCVPQSVR